MAFSRVLLAAAWLVFQWGSPLRAPKICIDLIGLYLGYGSAAALAAWLQRGSYILLGLVLDVIAFLVTSAHPANPFPWLPGVFFLYVLASALGLHHQREVLLVSLAGLSFFLLAAPPNGTVLTPVMGLMSALALLGSIQKGRMEKELYRLTREAAQYRTDTEKERDAERQRLADDFHDGPVQAFMSLQMRLQLLRRTLERDFAAGLKELEHLQDQWKKQTLELRAFLRSMRPTEAGQADLAAAVTQAVEAFEKDTGISVAFRGAGPIVLDDPSRTVEMLNVVREALHNVQKHAGASKVSVSLENAARELRLIVEDDGSGFSFSGAYDLDELDALQLGPASIKRRVRGLNGAMVVESHPGRGATLKIRIPQ